MMMDEDAARKLPDFGDHVIIIIPAVSPARLYLFERHKSAHVARIILVDVRHKLRR